jgi:ubiquitin C-terminal hydrolase
VVIEQRKKETKNKKNILFVMLVTVESSFPHLLSSSSSSSQEREQPSTPIISNQSSRQKELTETINLLSLQSSSSSSSSSSTSPVSGQQQQNEDVDDKRKCNGNKDEKNKNKDSSYQNSNSNIRSNSSNINDDTFHRGAATTATVAKFSCPDEEPLIVQYSTITSSSSSYRQQQTKNTTSTSSVSSSDDTNNNIRSRSRRRPRFASLSPFSVLFPVATTAACDQSRNQNQSQNNYTMMSRVTSNSSSTNDDDDDDDDDENKDSTAYNTNNEHNDGRHVTSGVVVPNKLADLNMMFFLVCDYFRSGIPVKILRHSIGQLFHLDGLFYLPQFLFMPGTGSSYWNNNNIALTGKQQQRTPRMGVSRSRRLQYRRQQRRRSAQQRRERHIHISGLPNQGQTCFLNSVIQSLASLEPFLAYLEGIVQFQEEMEQVVVSSSSISSSSGQDNDDNYNDIKRKRNSSPSFSQELLDLLKGINYVPAEEEIGDDFFQDDDEISQSDGGGGVFSSFRRRRQQRRKQKLDPKVLLRQIAKRNQQFHTYGMEQQDAQELFAALMEVVIADAELDSSSSSDRTLEAYNSNRSNSNSGFGSSDPYFIGSNSYYENNNNDDEDGLMTSVFANTINDKRELTSTSTTTTTANSGTGLILADEDESNILSLSGLLLRIREEQNKSSSESSIDDSLSATSVTKSCYGIQHKQEKHHHRFVEEKKQEHNDCPGNTVDVTSLSSSSSSSSSSHRKENKRRKSENNHSSISNGSSSIYNYPRQKLSKVKNNMRGTMSSITPSPLSGWLGSTLRCSKCKHVRPIQNAPFLDIPLVPTSVPNYLSKAYNSSTVKPISPNTSSLPSCTLDQCLADFTSVERVQDVECQFCTIQQEIDNLDEEAMMLRGAVETAEKRINRKNKGRHNYDTSKIDDSTEQTKYLREDLSKVETILLKLKTMDPDEDGIIEHSLGSIVKQKDDSFLFDFEKKTSIPIQRCEAKKCLLLTRTPSILCCHIQRRYYDPFTNRMEKCNQFVEFSQFLDLSPYCVYGPRAITPWAAGSYLNEDENDRQDISWSSSNNNNNSNKMPYRLQSVIEHQGNAYGGHYVSYRRDHTGSWFRISDSRVVKVSWRDVQTCQAYMLFYESM